MSAVTSERVLRVDLTGSKLGPAWRGSEQYGDWPADWSDDRLRQECADHFAIPVEQVTVIPANAEVCPGCEWHILADGCRGDSDACVRPWTPRRRERLHGEVVVRPVPEDHPVQGELVERQHVEAVPVAPRIPGGISYGPSRFLPSQAPVYITVETQSPSPSVEGWPTWKRLVGWGATIIGTALLIIALLGPPHIVQSHHRPPDLVNPSR